MANLDFYASEIDGLLRQVPVNEDDIGMRRINVLAIPDGDFDVVTDEVPDTMTLDVVGDVTKGSISVAISGEADASSTTITAYSDFAKLTTLGTETGVTGIIKPGRYVMSLGGSDSTADMPWQDNYPPEVLVTVTDRDPNSESYSVTYDTGDVEITVPNNFTKVEFRLNLWFGSFNGAYSCDLYPLLCLKALEDEPFEPYKPDLQTQINALPQAENVARLTDAVGTEGSINIYPIDKGVLGDPVIYDAVEGEFAVMQADATRDIPSVVTFTGTSQGTTETTADYKSLYNYGYDFDSDNPFLFGDLVPDDYVLSFDVFDESGFSDVAEFYFEVYEKAIGSSEIYGDKIATCTGSNTEFTVTAAKPMITILAVAKRHAGDSWSGAAIYAVPFLRRKIFATAARDEYQPPIKKQLAEIRYQISALRSLIVNNVIQTDKITDTSEEGPLT